MFKAIVFGLAVIVAAPAAAKDKAPEILKRTGKWEVNYDRDACHLAAKFGDAKEPTMIMRITRYQPGDSFTLGLYGSRVTTPDLRTKATLDFGLSADPIQAETTNGNVGKFKAAWISGVRLDGKWSGPDEARPELTPEREAAVTGLTVDLARKRPFRLEFGSIAHPMAQLRACETHLVKSWGYDPEQQAHLSRPATGKQSPAEWLSASDYPMQAIRMGHNGIVQFRLDVDEAGKVAGCHVLDRTEPDDFADMTCKLVARRAKLEPALDAGGKPVRSFIVQRVQWHVAGS